MSTELRRLNNEVNRLSCLVGQLIATTRVTTQSTFAMVHLRAKWPTLSEDRIRALAIEHAGYVPTRGRALELHLDDVMRIDAVLAGRLVVGPGHVGRTPSCQQSTTQGAA